MHKVIKLAFIIIFFVIIFLPVLFSDKTGGKKSELENRYLAKMPSIKELSIDSFEKWINDNIGYRNIIMHLKAYVEFHLFNKTSSYKVAIGKDGFLFYTENENINIALNKYQYTDVDYKNTAQELNNLKKIIEKQNIKFIYIMPPSKASIYPEKIRGYNLDIIETPVDIMEKYLPDNFNYINLKPVLLQHKNKENIDKLFYKTDTHWTYYGAYLGYLGVIDYINENNILDSKINPVKVSFTDDEHLGDLSNMLGGETIVAKEKSKKTIIDNKTFIKQKLNDKLLAIQKNSNGGYIGSYINPKSTNDINVLCIVDSMFAFYNMPELFAQTFKKYTYAYRVNLSSELIEQVKPDIVIYEVAERILKYSAVNVIKNYITLENKVYKDSVIKDIDKAEIVESDIFYYLDKNNIQNHNYLISGWAYLQNIGKTGQVYVGIKDKSGKETYYTADMFARPDVVQYFNNNADLLNCGYSVSIKVKNKEDYKLSSIIIEYNEKYYRKPVK